MIPSEIDVISNGDKVRFEFEGASTGWMCKSDSFIERIDEDKLNKSFFEKHILKEIEIRNLLDEGISFLNEEDYRGAIECFDQVLFYDDCYGGALIGKSHALYGQGHFIKALRYYNRAIEASAELEDDEYHELLLSKSGEERDSLPEFKRHIYDGDEYFRSGDYQKALESYENALANPSEAKKNILFRLLNKIAAAHIKLNDFESGLYCFNESLNQLNNDCAWYGKGVCEYNLELDGACESLAHAGNLKKDQLLEKGLILNELECWPQAVETFEFIMENHFTQDEIYVKALNGLEYAKGKLD